MTAQPSSQAEREDVALRTALVEYAMHYGPRCRECADHGDICPMSGMACGERRKATEFVVNALIYGATHGHCPSALSAREHATPRSMPEEVVEAYERAAKMLLRRAGEWRSSMIGRTMAQCTIPLAIIEELHEQAAAIRAIPGASA